MKRLIVNGIEIILDKGLTFPYSVKNFDLENPTLINIDKSKSIELKRCNTNDEAFGFIANNSRINTSTVSGSGVLFNPIKKNNYQLLEDSELISEGIVNVLEANDKVIIIELYDALLEKFNELDDKYINDVNLFTERKINVDFITTPPEGIVPVFGLDDTSMSTTSILCRKYNGKHFVLDKVEIPESKPIDLQTFKSYDCRFATPVENMINKINEQWDIIDNQYDFEGLHLLSNKLTPFPYYNDRVVNVSTGGFNNAAPQGSISNGELNAFVLSDNLTTLAQKINIISGVNFTLRSDNPSVTHLVRQLNSENNARTVSSFNMGDYIGTLKVTTTLKFYKGSINVDNINSITNIDLLWGRNFLKRNNTDLVYTGKISSNFNVSIMDYDTFKIETHITNVVTPRNPGDNYPNDYMWFFRKVALHNIGARYSITSSHEMIETNSDKMNSNLKINTKSMLPKIKVKDFILALIKSFNLHTEIVNGKILLREKSFKYTAELPIINLNNTKQSRLINEQKIILDNDKATDARLDNYKTKYDKAYGEQVVDLGYTINTKKKEIKLPFSIPFWQRGINYWAYGEYLDYNNGGYSRTPVGSFVGLKDKLTFGYLADVKSDLYVSDDSQNEIIDNDSEFGTYNEYLHYIPDSSNFRWTMRLPIIPLNQIVPTPYDTVSWKFPKLHYYKVYKTLSPYNFKNNVIYKSLELNKPLESYGNVTNAVYSQESTHYNTYFANMFSQLYDQDAYIIEVDMLIKSKLDFETIFNWNNTDYIIYAIDEYEPQKVGVFRVKLIRVMDKFKLMNLYNRPDVLEIKSVLPVKAEPTYKPMYVSASISKNIYSGKIINYSGLCYSKVNPEPTILDTVQEYSGFTDNPFIITSEWGQTIYVRAYLKFTDGTVLYSSAITINLPQAIVKPTVVINTSPVGVDGIKFEFTELFDGRSPITAQYVYVKQGVYVDRNSYDKSAELYAFTPNINIGNLVSGKQYSWLVILSNGYEENYYYGSINIPVIINPYIQFPIRLDSTTTSINVQYEIEGGTYRISDYRLLWSVSPLLPNVTTHTGMAYLNSNSGQYNITGLLPSTTYNIRIGVYIRDTSSWFYGPTTPMSTNSNPPQLSALVTATEGSSFATALCNYTVDVPSNITERGVCWALNVIPTVNDEKVFDTVQTNGSIHFNISELNGLEQNNYWFRPYLRMGNSYVYGNVVRMLVFDSRRPDLPEIMI